MQLRVCLLRAGVDRAHGGADGADGELGEPAELLGEGVGAALQLVGREEAGGEPDAKRLLGLDHLGAHQHLLGLGGADEVGEALTHDPTRTGARKLLDEIKKKQEKGK